jgi:hypothetical protein
MLTGKPDAGNLHVRFDEGEWQDWHVYVAACRSLLYCLQRSEWLKIRALTALPIKNSEEPLKMP